MSDFNELTAGQKWYVVHTYTGHENKVNPTHTVQDDHSATL